MPQQIQINIFKFPNGLSNVNSGQYCMEKQFCKVIQVC